MKRISLLIISILFSAGIFAQVYGPVEVKHIHEFGFHAGGTTGVGLSYRFWPNKLGLQLTALPIKTSEMTYISLGVTGLYSFYDSRHIRFFGYLGNSLTIDDYNFFDYDDYEYDRGSRYNIGIGPGFGFGTRVRVNIMAGYGFYDITGEFNIYPTGEIGLYFRL